MLLAPTSPDGTGKRAVFHPTSIPSILFGVLLAHDNNRPPALTPELGPGFPTDIGVQLNSLPFL